MPGLDPIIAVDFDGTLCYADYPNIGKPRLEIIEYVKMCREIEKARLILWCLLTHHCIRYLHRTLKEKNSSATLW